jgi:cell shape-determining protein MreC
MSRRVVSYPYLILAFFLFCWINLPQTASDRARSFTVASFSPFWRWSEKTDRNKSESAEIARLRLENQNLRSQVEAVYEWLLSDAKVNDQVELLKHVTEQKTKAKEAYWRSFFQRRTQDLRFSLEAQLTSFPAQVIYRDPSSWSSSLWIKGGEEDNEAIGKVVIGKNSPVLSGGALVGVIDYVGKSQSRVRLITDSGLAPAVRAVRGASQNRELAQQLQAFLQRVEKREDLFSSQNDKERLIVALKEIQEKIGVHWEDGYLAKGEVHGSSAPFWRSRMPMLQGVGFNFDYADEEGSHTKVGSVPILKEGDLLVTSGLDGVFPAGLLVGIVAWMSPVKEGAYAYELKARPCANNLNDLQTLFVLPPVNGE